MASPSACAAAVAACRRALLLQHWRGPAPFAPSRIEVIKRGRGAAWWRPHSRSGTRTFACMTQATLQRHKWTAYRDDDGDDGHNDTIASRATKAQWRQAQEDQRRRRQPGSSQRSASKRRRAGSSSGAASIDESMEQLQDMFMAGAPTLDEDTKPMLEQLAQMVQGMAGGAGASAGDGDDDEEEPQLPPAMQAFWDRTAGGKAKKNKAQTQSQQQSTGTQGTTKVAAQEDSHTIVVEDYNGIKRAFRQVLRRIHPDVVHLYPPQVSKTNEASMQTLQQIMDAVELHSKPRSAAQLSRQEARDKARAPPGRASMTFFFECARAKKLRTFTIQVERPVDAEARERAANSAPARRAAVALWLAHGMKLVQKLVQKVGLDMQLRLAPELQRVAGLDPQGMASPDHAARGHGASATSGFASTIKHRPFATGAFAQEACDELTKENLLEHAPLIQGKVFNFPKQRIGVPSQFGLRKREAVVGAVVDAGCIQPDPRLPLATRRQAAKRLVNAMIDHFDPMQVYHPLWMGIHVVIRASGTRFVAAPGQLTLYIPADFDDAALARFVLREFRPMQEMALKATMKRVRKEEGARKRAERAAMFGRELVLDEETRDYEPPNEKEEGDEEEEENDDADYAAAAAAAAAAATATDEGGSFEDHSHSGDDAV